MIIMAIAGIGILKTMQRHLKELLGTYSDIKNQETMVHDSVNTLKSMAGIYDNVNLLIFSNMTEVALRGADSADSTHNIEGCDHTYMVNEMKKNISPDQLDSFMEFTDLRTLRDRLKGKKSIYAEFINVVTGWFRAQYITVETSEDGIPQMIVFTVQNIEKDKRKESNLIKMAHTDELTRLYNRRRYDEEICLYRQSGLDQGFSLLSADVNGLKITNDTKGHAAGDELIKGAADCLHSAVAPYGQVYRTGGDEFMAILHIDDYTVLISEIEARAKIWRGNYSSTLSISLGCVSHCEFPDYTVDELEHVADNRMYEAKEQHYKKAGIDRRKK
jgi:diguanylate cyclase (GGDEF)-like protein